MLLAIVDDGNDFLFEVVPLPDCEAPTLPLADCDAPPLPVADCDTPPLPLANREAPALALPEPVLLLQVVLLCPIPLHTLHLIAVPFLDSLP